MNQRIAFIICAASSMLIVWGVLTLASSQAANATAVSSLTRYIPLPLWGDSIVMLLAGANGLWVFFWKRRPSISALALLGLQICLMWLAGLGAIRAIISSHFADGEERSRVFIAADQSIWIILMVLHAAAIIYWFHRGRVWKLSPSQR